MTTIAAYFPEQELRLYGTGTSDGAKKGWDERGRGRKAKPTMGKINKIEDAPSPEHAAVLAAVQHPDFFKKPRKAVGRVAKLFLNDVEDEPRILSIRERAKKQGWWDGVFGYLADQLDRIVAYRDFGSMMMDAMKLVGGGGLTVLVTHVMPILHHLMAIMH